MLGTLIVVIITVLSSVGAFRMWGTGWAIGCGIISFLVSWVVLGLLLRRAVVARQGKIQMIMQEAQNKVNRQIEMFHRRPPSSMKAAQQIVEKIQNDAVNESLAAMSDFEPLYKWNLMLRKQINTMKVQLYYQLKDYKMVDEVLKNVMFVDPQTLCIKLVRMYRNEDAALDKFFKSKARRFRGENGAFIACVYAWIKIKQDDVRAALNALADAKKLSDNQVLLDNIDALSNNRVKHFSCAGFGEVWYALGLEEPKQPKPPKRQMGRNF